jgi:hypothetical protein
VKYARQDSNLQPSVPKTDALSNCATGANAEKALFFSVFRHFLDTLSRLAPPLGNHFDNR